MSIRRRPKTSEIEISHLVHQIYEAALDPSLWNVFLERAADAMAADSTGLVVHDHARKQGQMAVMARFDSSLQREYDAHYASVNIWKNRYISRYQPGKVLNASSLCSDSEFERSEWYADYLRRADVYYSMGAVLFRDDLSSGTLTVLRSKRQGPFNGEERILEALCPHVQRALKIHRRIGNSAASYDALNTVPFGVILLDLRLQVLFVNDVARDLCGKNDGLAVRSARIVASSQHDQKLLEALLSRTALFASGGTDTLDDHICVRRLSGKTPYQLSVTPVRLRFRFDPYSPAILVFVNDPTAGSVNPAMLVKLFGFTRQESRLAAMLAGGKELAVVAIELNITYETARKHLQRLLQKTGAHRQSELVRLILGGVATLAPGSKVTA
jgi:DNA-binding CsgD family transcriptional regulator